MKKLTRIILVNWYLFEAEEWDIAGNVALLGENGAGKSSFLDAVQYLMLGGKRDWRPNAKASDGTKTRDIKGYVLGKIQDDSTKLTEASYRPRDEALCRMALVFRDDVSGQETTIGAALSARAVDDAEKVEAYFVLNNYGLRLGDFLTENNGQSYPKPYSELKAHLQQITRGEECFLFNQGSKYLDQVLYSLSMNGMVPDSNKFRSTFKKSITLSSIGGSVSDFVKTSVLHSEPINVKTMRDNYDSFKNKKAEVKKTKEQIDQLKRILSLYNSAYSASELATAFKWCIAELNFDRLSDQVDSIGETIDASVDSYNEAIALLKLSSSQLEKDEAELSDLRILINNDQSEATKRLLEEQKRSVEGRIATLAKDLASVNTLLSKVNRLAKDEALSDEAKTALGRLASYQASDQSHWPTRPADIDAAIEKALPILQQEIKLLKEEHDRLVIQGAKDEDKARHLQKQLKAINEGRAALSDHTQGLLDALREEGFDAAPICQLIEVSDKSWQAPIEAYLKKQTEALLVPPEQAIDAVEYYKTLKRDYYGVQVVNTLKVQDWHDEIRPGTAAALITGSDPLAVKYIQRLLKNVELVETTKDLMHRQRAITRDGMEQGGGSAQRNRLDSLPRLGAPTEQQKQQVAAECQAFYQLTLDNKKKIEDLDALKDQATSLSAALQLPTSVSALTNELQQKQAQADDLLVRIEAVDTSKTVKLREQAVKLEGRCHELNKKVKTAIQNKGSLKSTIQNAIKNKRALEARLPAINDDRNAVKSDPYFNAERAANVLDDISTTFNLESDDSFDRALLESDKRQRGAVMSSVEKGNKADAALENFNIAYGAEGVDINLMEKPDLRKRREATRETLYRLESMGLHQRQEAAAKALEDLRRSFREEVTTKLHIQINEMRIRLNELNKELEKRPFTSGVIYRFKYERLQEFRRFLDYVDNITSESVANRDSLFDTEGEESLKLIEEILEGEKAEELLDYRNYFNYDILIKNKDGSEELFSVKKGSGSGGEQSAPFYVAMGASLASAYRIRSTEQGPEGGASIYLADEAFDKLSHKNTLASAEYLKSIGLQLFLAAPDIREADFTEFCETTLFFTRYGGQMKVSKTITTPKLRQMLSDAYNVKGMALDTADNIANETELTSA